MIASEEQARSFVAEFGTAAAVETLDILCGNLREENARQNLVSRGSLDHIWQRHIADSAQLLAHVPRETSGVLLDLGSGAGFPGLVLAALRPEQPIHLIESRRKRVDWLQSQIEALALRNCTVVGSRLELVETVPASVITARAFAPLSLLLNLSARFSTDSTIWLLPKGRKAEQEWCDLPKRIRDMFHVEHSQTDPDAGVLVGRGRVSKGELR